MPKKKLGNETQLKKPITDDWYRLDNAAMIYPSAASDKWNAVYRISVFLKEDVDPVVLNSALKAIIPRFPSFNVFLRRGFFWFYFQKANKIPSVEIEQTFPCRPMPIKSAKHLFRVLYFKNKISLEVFHSISDGFGALQFLNTLILKYFSFKEIKFDLAPGAINVNDKPKEEEIEDSFSKYADLAQKNKWREKKAYQINGTRIDRGSLNIITGVVPTDKLLVVCREKNSTITEFLTAVFFNAIIEYQKDILIQNKPIKISVPVNLRKFFKSETLRNFSSFLNLEISRKESNKITFLELLQKVKDQMKAVNKENLLKNINANVGIQKNIWIRIAPLFVKNIALKASYSWLGERLYSTVLSNLGRVDLPESVAQHIERYDCYIGESKVNNITLGVISFENELSISFSSKIKETKIMRDFFRMLSSFGIPVKVVSNIN